MKLLRAELAAARLENHTGTATSQLLTARERQVLLLIVEGCSTKEIAARLGIAFKTATSHRANLMEKLGAHSVAELVVLAFTSGLVKLQNPGSPSQSGVRAATASSATEG